MLIYVLLQKVLDGTPGPGNSRYDLIIIMACLGILTGMVYLFKYLLEKSGVARRRNVLSGSESIEKENP